jgi:MSHA pilin protein MshA
MMNTMISRRNPHTQSGFTLVELIMVIVILGVLSAFALPKFANLTDDADAAAVKGAKAAVSSAVGIVHAAWLAGGNTGAAVLTLEGVTIGTSAGGYPTLSKVDEAAGLDCTNDWDCIASGTTVLQFARKNQLAVVGSTCFEYDVTTAAVSATKTVTAANSCP